MSTVEDEYKHIYRSGCSERFKTQDFLPEHDIRATKTKLNAQVGFVHRPMSAKSNPDFKAALNSAYEKMLIKSVRMAFLAGHEAGNLQSQIKMDEQLIDKQK